MIWHNFFIHFKKKLWKEQNFPPLFYEVMNAFVQFALSSKDTCTHNNMARARLKLRKEYFLLSSSYLLLMLWWKLIYVPKEIEIKTHSLRDTFFSVSSSNHHQYLYEREISNLWGIIHVSASKNWRIHSCMSPNCLEILITDNDVKNFFTHFFFKWRFSTWHFKELKNLLHPLLYVIFRFFHLGWWCYKILRMKRRQQRENNS